MRERSGDLPEARQEAETSLKLKPSVAAWLVLSRLDLQKGDVAASVVDVQNALRIDPKDSAALGMRQALQSRGQNVP